MSHSSENIIKIQDLAVSKILFSKLKINKSNGYKSVHLFSENHRAVIRVSDSLVPVVTSFTPGIAPASELGKGSSRNQKQKQKQKLLIQLPKLRISAPIAKYSNKDTLSIEVTPEIAKKFSEIDQWVQDAAATYGKEWDLGGKKKRSEYVKTVNTNAVGCLEIKVQMYKDKVDCFNAKKEISSVDEMASLCDGTNSVQSGQVKSILYLTGIWFSASENKYGLEYRASKLQYWAPELPPAPLPPAPEIPAPPKPVYSFIESEDSDSGSDTDTPEPF